MSGAQVLRDPKQKRFFKSKDIHDLFTLGPQYAGASETASIFSSLHGGLEVPLDPDAMAVPAESAQPTPAGEQAPPAVSSIASARAARTAMQASHVEEPCDLKGKAMRQQWPCATHGVKGGLYAQVGHRLRCRPKQQPRPAAAARRRPQHQLAPAAPTRRSAAGAAARPAQRSRRAALPLQPCPQLLRSHRRHQVRLIPFTFQVSMPSAALLVIAPTVKLSTPSPTFHSSSAHIGEGGALDYGRRLHRINDRKIRTAGDVFFNGTWIRCSGLLRSAGDMDDAKILRDLFDGTGVMSALDHSKIEGANNPEALNIDAQAARIARKAAEALKRSRQVCQVRSAPCHFPERLPDAQHPWRSTKAVMHPEEKAKFATQSERSDGVFQPGIYGHIASLPKGLIVVELYIIAENDSMHRLHLSISPHGQAGQD